MQFDGCFIFQMEGWLRHEVGFTFPFLTSFTFPFLTSYTFHITCEMFSGTDVLSVSLEKILLVTWVLEGGQAGRQAGIIPSLLFLLNHKPSLAVPFWTKWKQVVQWFSTPACWGLSLCAGLCFQYLIDSMRAISMINLHPCQILDVGGWFPPPTTTKKHDSLHVSTEGLASPLPFLQFLNVLRAHISDTLIMCIVLLLLHGIAALFNKNINTYQQWFLSQNTIIIFSSLMVLL